MGCYAAGDAFLGEAVVGRGLNSGVKTRNCSMTSYAAGTRMDWSKRLSPHPRSCDCSSRVPAFPRPGDCP